MRSISWRIIAVGLVATGLVACGSGAQGSQPLSGGEYVAAMDAICNDTELRLDALPAPPQAISATDWANEVGLAFTAEAERSDDLVVDASIGSTHRSFVATTGDLAERYAALSATLTDDPDGLEAISTEITQLSLGRDDIAAELGLSACIRSDA